jgi:hypothetical protein
MKKKESSRFEAQIQLRPEDLERLIGGIKVLLRAELMKVQDWEYPWENMPPQDLKVFAIGRATKVLTDFWPYLNHEIGADLMKYAADFFVEFYRSKKEKQNDAAGSIG